jgi:TetR/AcrR family transcriptional repressor of nem operon
VRQPQSVRHAVKEALRSRLEALQKLLPGRSAALRRDKALVTMAGLVGALMLSRAVGDPKLSDDFLKAAAATLGRA